MLHTGVYRMVTPVLLCPDHRRREAAIVPRLSKKYKQEWAFFLDHR